MASTRKEDALQQPLYIDTVGIDLKMEDVAVSHAFIGGKEVQNKEADYKKMKKCVCCKVSIPARVQLGVMAFLMFFVTQMIRSNLYIARVDMIENVNNTATQDNCTKKLNWNEQEVGMVLGAFYGSYWITELPGGLLAQRYGGRRVVGFAVLLAGVINLLFPLACQLHYIAAVALRALQGLALGVTWPSMHTLSAHWIPPTERSKFMTSYHGAAFGTALTFFLSGLLMSVLDWESVFYMTGGVTLAWCAGWWYVVYDSPAQHPRISNSEQKYLERALGDIVASHKGPPLQTPWKSILLSAPFWAVLLASQGLMWGTITMSMQVPAYFKSIYNLDIKTNGFVSSIPELCKFAFSVAFSTVMDYMLHKEYLSITAARKISVATCEFLPAILLVVLAFLSTESATVSVILLAAMSALGGASSSGSLPNIVDLSPNFAGTLLGIIKTLTMIPGVLSPNMVSLLNNSFGPTDCWYYVFITMAIVYILTGAVYIFLGSGEVQPWNQPKFESLPVIVKPVSLPTKSELSEECTDKAS